MGLMARIKSLLRPVPEPTSRSLPRVAIVVTSSCDADDFEDAMTELLERSKQFLEVEFFESSQEDLLTFLGRSRFALIVIVDKLCDHEESCSLMSKITTSEKLNHLFLESFTIIVNGPEDDTSPSDQNIDGLEQMVLRVLSKPN
jgi:hypothetical protein